MGSVFLAFAGLSGLLSQRQQRRFESTIGKISLECERWIAFFDDFDEMVCAN
jgi:hypothetical protein